MVFIDSWNPIVYPVHNEHEVAQTLIKESKTFVTKAGFERIEILLNRITERQEQLYRKYIGWYETQGWYRVNEEGYMQIELDKNTIPHLEIPADYETLPFTEKSNDEIQPVFFEIFLNSKDRLFLDMTPDQQAITFNWWFNRSRHWIKEASRILLKSGEIVGFCLIRQEGKGAQVGPTGVHPDHRRKGLAKALLSSALQVLKKQGIKEVGLEYDLENRHALNLYRKFGFKKLHKQAYYCWKADSSTRVATLS